MTLISGFYCIRWRWILGEGTEYQDLNASILSVNTIFNGKCYVWTASIKGQKNDPKAIFYVQVPNNKWVFYRQFFYWKYYLGGFHIWRPLWVGGVPKKQTKGTKSTDLWQWQGGRGKKIRNFADVIYGSPLSNLSSLKAHFCHSWLCHGKTSREVAFDCTHLGHQPRCLPTIYGMSGNWKRTRKYRWTQKSHHVSRRVATL